MKVIEFKMSPHKEAIEAWEYQLDALKTVWNSALALRIEDDSRYWIERSNLATVCPGTVLRRKGNKKLDQKSTQWRTIASGVRRSGKDGTPYAEKPIPAKERGEIVGTIAGPYCSVRKLQGVNPLSGTGHVDDDGNRVTSALSRCESPGNYPHLDKKITCSKFSSGVFKSLNDAWIAYKKGIRKRPKFKNKKDKLKSLTNRSGSVKLIRSGQNNGLAKFPKIPRPVRVKGLFKRYHEGMETGPQKVVKRGGEWYFQMTIKNPEIKAVKPSDKSVGLDPGVKVNLITDQGKTFHCKQAERIAQRVAKLQRKASRQYEMNKGNKDCKLKTHARTQREIARLKAKQARSRKAWQHKSSSRIISEFGVIAIEDTQVKNMTRKPKPKPNGKGGYEPNGAAAKSGLNKAVLKSGIGGVKVMLKSKAKDHGRDFVLVPAAYTSATCSQCEYQHKREEKPRYRPNQATFICQGCGHSENADVNAAKNIKREGLKILAATH